MIGCRPRHVLAALLSALAAGAFTAAWPETASSAPVLRGTSTARASTGVRACFALPKPRAAARGFLGTITVGHNLTTADAMHELGITPPGMTLIANLLDTDPQLVDPPDDFHLLPTSPAIDTGETIPSVVFDYDGASRPFGAGYDRGAFEFR